MFFLLRTETDTGRFTVNIHAAVDVHLTKRVIG